MINFIKDKIQGRSSKWRRTREIHLYANGCCIACNTKEKLEVHHIIPFAVDKELELDHSNLVTLCSTCHLVFGHLRDYETYNHNVLTDCMSFSEKKKLAKRITEK